MKEEIIKLIDELKVDIKELDAEIKGKQSKLTKLQLIVAQLENIINSKE